MVLAPDSTSSLRQKTVQSAPLTRRALEVASKLTPIKRANLDVIRELLTWRGGQCGLVTLRADGRTRGLTRSDVDGAVDTLVALGKASITPGKLGLNVHLSSTQAAQP